MAFRDRLASFFRIGGAARTAVQAASIQSSGPGRLISGPEGLEIWLRGLDAGTASGAVVTADTAMGVATVYRCVAIIAGAVATMPLALKRRVNETTRLDASDHPLWDLLRKRPNGWMTPSGFRRMLQAHLLLRGCAYAMIVRAPGTGKVLSLIPMHPDRVKCEQLDDLTLVYTYTRRDGKQVTLPQSEVFHLIGMTLDGVNGLSVISYAREAIGLAMQTETHGATVFKNGTSVGGVLTHPGKLGAEAQTRLRASLDAFRGAANAHKSMILEEGMKFEPLGMTAEDAQYIETRRFTRNEIAMFFGVPPHMIGDTEKSTSWGSGIEQQSLGFVAYTLQDWLTTWEETITRDLIAPSDRELFARFNTKGLLRGDIQARFQAYAIGLQWGIYSPDEVRAFEEENPRPDGQGARYYDPPNTAGRSAAGPTNGPSNGPA